VSRPAWIRPAPWALLLAVLGTGCAAHAGDGARRAGAARLPKYRLECAACHVAYPPAMLPAASWRRLLGGLPHHFGVDASLDAASVGELAAWLDAHAGTDRHSREAPPEDRITRSAGFLHEHDEVPPAVWKRPAVRSAANCAACHTRADQGDFDEHAVRIPR
jgi:hypothetical protein